jgi:hypothetical protein
MTIEFNRAAVRFVTVGLAVGLVVTGCSKEDKSASASSTSSSAASSATSSAADSTSSEESSEAPAGEPDYEALLMKPEAIPSGAGTFLADPPKVDTSSPPDVTQNFHPADNTASIFAQVIVETDPAAAAAGLEVAKSKLPDAIVGQPQPVPSVTANAVTVAGTSKDGSKAVTGLVFAEQNTVVQLMFISAPGDLNPVPTDFVESVGKAQLDAVQQGLPNLGE